MHLHVHTCAPLFHKCSACCFSVTVGPIALKFGMHWEPISYSLCSSHGWVSLHVRTCTPRFCISQTARPIVFKFGVWVSSHYQSAFHKSWVGYLCMCARADRTSVSQERLGRLSSILVCELGVMNYYEFQTVCKCPFWALLVTLVTDSNQTWAN